MLLLGSNRPCHFVIVKKKGVSTRCMHRALDQPAHGPVVSHLSLFLHVARQIKAQWLVRGYWLW